MCIGKLAFMLAAMVVCEPFARLWADPAPGPGGAAIPAASPTGNPPAARNIVPSDDDDQPSGRSTRTPVLAANASDDDDQPRAPGARTPPAGRYLFGLLDSQSSDGKDFFPDTFIGPEFDRETQFGLEYAHGQKQNLQSNEGGLELEWNFLGQFTLAGGLGYDSEDEQEARVGGGAGRRSAAEANANGFESVELALYHPVFQFVSKDGRFDYTAVARLDLDLPTHTAVSGTDVQLTPYLGQLLRVGDHVSLEAWTGQRFTLAHHQNSQFIYGALGAYKIARSQMALPLTRSVTPIFELDGQIPIANGGRDALFGVAGFSWQSTDIGKFQPRISLGYQLPIDRGARDELRWGIVTEVFFDF